MAKTRPSDKSRENRKLLSRNFRSLLYLGWSTDQPHTIHSQKKEPIMGKGNNSQKNDKKDKKPKQDKKGTKIEAAKKTT